MSQTGPGDAGEAEEAFPAEHSEPPAVIAEAIAPPAVIAKAIRMTGPWGPVYGPVDVVIPDGGVTVLICPAGIGRIALLMTIAGRMKPVGGSIAVFGATRAKDIFRRCGMAGIAELDTVSESVTVRDLITEQLRWDASWYRMIAQAKQADLEAVCAPIFGPLPLPPLMEYFSQLSELDQLLLRIALANTRRPQLLVVGNLDFVTSDAHRDTLIERLIDLGRSQTIVTATVNGVTGHAAPDGGKCTPNVRSQLVVTNTDRAELLDSQKGSG